MTLDEFKRGLAVIDQALQARNGAPARGAYAREWHAALGLLLDWGGMRGRVHLAAFAAGLARRDALIAIESGQGRRAALLAARRMLDLSQTMRVAAACRAAGKSRRGKAAV